MTEQYLGPNAAADEEEDKAFHARHAQAAANENSKAHYVTRSKLRRELDQLAENVGAAVAQWLTPLKKRLEKLESANLLARAATADLLSQYADRISSLESETRLRFCGVYEAGQTYHKGSLVSADGSLFYCHAGTDKRPGTTHDWQLCCKRGRDAR